jgi:hypothetical protein
MQESSPHACLRWGDVLRCYERLGVYNIASVVYDFIERVLVNGTLDAKRSARRACTESGARARRARGRHEKDIVK